MYGAVQNVEATAVPIGKATVTPIPDVVIPAAIETTVNLREMTVTVRADWQAATGSFDPVNVTIAASPGQTIAASALRTIPLARITAAGANSIIPAHWPEPAPVDAAAGPTDTVLTAVAAWYRRSLACGIPPQQEIADRLHVPKATAARWITRARDRGLIDLERAKWTTRSRA